MQRRVRVGWIVALAMSVGACDGSEEVEGEDSGGSGGAASGNGVGAGSDGNDSDDGVPSNDYCDPVRDWDTAMVEFEEDVLVLVNEARANGANCGGMEFGSAPPLTMDAALRCAARVHSQDMGDRSFFDHDTPEGEDPFQRMERAGYQFSTAGENIAAGQTSPQMVMEGWLASPGHCSNIMNASFTEFGVGVYQPLNGDFPYYWTQTFGAPL